MAQKQNSSGTLDGMPELPTAPLDGSMRSDSLYPQEDRIQSGSLKDDPTESGAPVKNRRSFKNLKGGSR